MRIAVYAIAKNEEQFVERWYESAKEADYLLIAEGATGQTCVQYTDSNPAGIGWTYDAANNTFIAPYVTDIEPPVTE